MPEQEDKKTAASYIYTFYEGIRLLTAYFAQYANVIQEVKARTNKDINSTVELTGEDYKVIMYCMQQLRGSAISTYVQLKAIETTTKIKVPDNLEIQYRKIYSANIIDSIDCEKFVISINTILVENIMQSLLQSAVDITNQIYSQNATETRTE